MTALFMTTWVWQPAGSPLHIVAGAVVLAALAVFAYARTMPGRTVAAMLLLLMRLMLVAALAVLMMGPSRIPPSARDIKRPRLIMLLDTSESMRSVDCDRQSRIRCAIDRVFSRRHLDLLQAEYRLTLLGFDEHIHPLATGHSQPPKLPGHVNRPELNEIEPDLQGAPPAITTDLHPSFSSYFVRRDDEIATGKATYLNDSITSALSQSIAREEGTVVCVLSDGRDTQDAPIQPAASLAKSQHIPVYSIGFGGESLTRDATLLAVPMQEYLMPGEPGAILVKIYQSGMGEASSTLKIKQGTHVESVPIAFNHKSLVELQVPIKQDQEGVYEYEVSLDTVSGEKEVANNSQIVFCDVHKKRIRILMLEGQPFWDSKFLAQSLRKDDRIELTQITQLSANKKETIVTRVESGSSRIPQTQEDWDKFDIVILGQAIENVLDRKGVEQLKQFVSERGGHLIFSRGRAYQPKSSKGVEIAAELATLEPVVWGEGQLQKVSLSLTPSGRTSPWFSTTKMNTNIDDAFTRLPGFDSMPAIEREKPATIVLARASASGAANAAANSQPAIVRMNFGRGIVVAVLGEGLWQWSLLTPERQDLTGFYDTFWSNLARWLAMGGDFPPGQQVALQLDRTSVRLGNSLLADVVYKQSAGGPPPHLTLTSPDGRKQLIAMSPVVGRESRFRAQIQPERAGVFQVALNVPESAGNNLERRFSVYDVNLEMLQASANLLPLKILAEHTGGKYFDAKNAGDLANELHRQRATMVVPPKLEYIWDNGIVMVLLLIWAGTEWLIRRLVGLL